MHYYRDSGSIPSARTMNEEGIFSGALGGPERSGREALKLRPVLFLCVSGVD